MTAVAARFAHVRAILFDLDGTLVDSAPDLGAAADQMRLDRGMPSLAYDEYRPLAGSGARGMLEVAFGVAPADPDFAALKDEFFVNYTRCLTQRSRPFDGVAALLADLNCRGLVWGIVTNKAARYSEPLTRATGIFAGAAALVAVLSALLARSTLALGAFSRGAFRPVVSALSSAFATHCLLGQRRG